MKKYIEFFKNKLLSKDDPIDSAKRMISIIQRFVGIDDVFGDKKLKWSMTSILAILLGGSFIYIGPFSQTVFLIRVFPVKLDTFQTLNCLSSTLVPLSKNIFMWTSRNRLRAIMKMSRYGLSVLPQGSSAQIKMLATLETGSIVSWIVIINQATIHILYLFLPFVFTVFGKERYLPTTPGETFGLSPKYESPFYEATFTITCLASIFSAVNQTGYIILFVTLAAHELGHFYAISETLNDIHEILSKNEEKSKNNISAVTKEVDEKLSFCVKHHQFLFKYHENIRELYNVIFGAHFLMMIIVLVTTLQTMNSWGFSNTILAGVTGIMPLIIYCFGGELLISAAWEMSASTYSCGWEMMSVQQSRVVLLMLCISQRKINLTAAGLITMNRETFGDVAQVIYKIYAVFN